MINYLIQIIAGALGTMGLMAMIGSPRRYLIHCAAIGSFTWFVYYFLYNGTDMVSEPIAALIGTVMGVFLARFLAVLEKCPVTIFLVSAIYPLVPGAGIFWTTFYFSTNQQNLAVDKGFLALKFALAIVLGIVVVFEIPQSFFSRIVGAFERRRRKNEKDSI